MHGRQSCDTNVDLCIIIILCILFLWGNKYICIAWEIFDHSVLTFIDWYCSDKRKCLRNIIKEKGIMQSTFGNTLTIMVTKQPGCQYLSAYFKTIFFLITWISETNCLFLGTMFYWPFRITIPLAFRNLLYVSQSRLLDEL